MTVNFPNKDNASNMGEFEYDRWRNRFLTVVLVLFCVFGLILFGAIFSDATTNERIFFGIIYLALIVATVTPIQYRLKVGVLLATGELIGLFGLTRFGPWSDSVLFFLATSIFASLLFNKRIDLWVFGINAVLLIGMAFLDQSGIFPLIAEILPPTTINDWITYILDYAVIGIVITWALYLLKTEFKSISDQFGSALSMLTKDRAELEQRVEERTAGLTKKTDQLRAASYIARQTAEAQDLASLLDTVVALITDQFGFNHAGIFLLNETGDEAILQAASSEGGKRMLEKGHSLTVGSQGIVGYVAAQKKSRIALDVGTDAVFFNNPDLPMTRSEVALPLLIRNRVLGVLDIQSDQPQAFHIEDVDVLQTLADQVAVAIDNARLLGETQAALMQLEAVTSFRTREAWTQKLEEQSRTFTYTPLGLRAEKLSNTTEQNAIQSAILLRGQQIGDISVERKDKTGWSKLDQDMIDEVAYQVGLAVDNLRLLEDAQQRAKREQTIGEIATRFSQSLDIDSLLQTAAREMGQLPDVSEVSVFIGQLPEQAASKRRAKRTTG